MIHLVVESAFDVKDGFWGRVDAGADPRVITERANRIGGSNKYSAFGEDLSGLALAEALANPGWLMESHSVEAIRLQILEGCRQANLAAPAVLTPERVAKVRAALEHLAAQWRGLNPKGAIQLVFDPTDPTRGFEQL
jgi:hypothetical protein